MVCRWSQVQNLVDDKSLLFYASNIQSKEGKVIKYVTQYGSEVHQTLSDAGLAPTLYDVVQLPGGFVQVSYTLTLVASLVASCLLDGQRYLSAVGHLRLQQIARWKWSCLLRRMDGGCYPLCHQKICCW